MIDGNRLRKLREEHDMSADQLAKALSMSKTQLLRYETENGDATTEVLKRLAVFFNVSTDYLVGLKDEPGKPAARKGPLSVSFDLTKLLNTLPPEKVASTLKGAGLPMRLKDDVIDVRQLLREFPPVYVARFLKEMGTEPQFKYDSEELETPE